jgi:hypothetical protein
MFDTPRDHEHFSSRHVNGAITKIECATGHLLQLNVSSVTLGCHCSANRLNF